jgi:chromosome segregation ATPase
MARPGVTYQDIANVAQQLLAQNRIPTIESIRSILGTGSNSTIATHFRKWKALQDETHPLINGERLPEALVSTLKGLWEQVTTQAKDQILLMQQKTEEEIAEFNQQLQQLEDENSRLKQQQHLLAKEKTALLNDKLELEQLMVKLQKENALLNSKGEGLNQQLQDKLERIHELNRLNKQVQNNLEHYRESMRAQRLIDQEKQAEQLQQLELSLKTTEQHLAKANQDTIALQKQLDKVINENSFLQKSHDAISHKFDKLQSAFSTIEKEHHKVKNDTAHWQQQYETIQKKFDDQNAMVIEQKKQNALLSQQVSMVQDEVKDLKDQNKLLVYEKLEIAQEKAQLEGVIKQMQIMMPTHAIPY